jgi:hypothetical protein
MGDSDLSNPNISLHITTHVEIVAAFQQINNGMAPEVDRTAPKVHLK